MSDRSGNGDGARHYHPLTSNQTKILLRICEMDLDLEMELHTSTPTTHLNLSAQPPTTIHTKYYLNSGRHVSLTHLQSHILLFYWSLCTTISVMRSLYQQWKNSQELLTSSGCICNLVSYISPMFESMVHLNLFLFLSIQTLGPLCGGIERPFFWGEPFADSGQWAQVPWTYF